MMKKRKLGNLEVSPIGMGCMAFSHGYGKAPEKAYSIQAIRKVSDFGCTFFDTAESYGKEQFYAGHNEELVGEALEPIRKEVVIATKLHIAENEISNGNTLYDVMLHHLRNSMKRLRTDYIDLYYLHRVNEQIPVEDVAEVMGIFIQKGFIRGWGLSQVSLKTLETAHHITPVTALQSLYSMVERGLEKEIIPYCLKNNIGIVPFSPIASGFLSGKVTPDTQFVGDDVRKFVPQLSKENLVANQPILDVLSDFSEKKKATNAQISLAWMLHKYPNIVPIPGSKNQNRILENLASWNVELSKSEFQELETALNNCVIYGHRGYIESEQNSFGHHWSRKEKNNEQN